MTAYAGNEMVIASIGILYALTPSKPLLVSFAVKKESWEGSMCDEWLYEVSTHEVWKSELPVRCYFDMDYVED